MLSALVRLLLYRVLGARVMLALAILGFARRPQRSRLAPPLQQADGLLEGSQGAIGLGGSGRGAYLLGQGSAGGGPRAFGALPLGGRPLIAVVASALTP